MYFKAICKGFHQQICVHHWERIQGQQKLLWGGGGGGERVLEEKVNVFIYNIWKLI